MIGNFQNKYGGNFEDILNIGQLISAGDLTNEEIFYLKKMKEAWNFYEGFHWEGIDTLDTPQVTYNYCRPFVNKFVSFEFGKGFTIETPTELENVGVTVNDLKLERELNDNTTKNDDILIQKEKTELDFLNGVWEDNNKDTLCIEIGQTKTITGDAWIKIQYESPEDLNDVFGKYPNGRIRLSVVPTQYVYPRFNNHDKDKLEQLLIMYPIRKEEETGLLFKRTSISTIIYKELWTKEEIIIFEKDKEVNRLENPYGFIPFVQIKNFPMAGRTRGQGDIDDIIPLNVEMNLKKSDVSEVIDYHSAPITLVYGAKIGNLEKGANKIWGGLPKDAKVENLHLQGDLTASNSYITSVKTAMCEISGIPETVLGGASAVSNTSGVALQYINLPLIERTRIKRACTETGFQRVNEYILFIAMQEGLIIKPDNISIRDFVKNTVKLPDTLPKDELMELQKIQQEMTLGIENRQGALERMGRNDILKKLKEVDSERQEHPELFNPMLQSTWYQNRLNSGGMMNGETPLETVRKEMTEQNGLDKDTKE